MGCGWGGGRFFRDVEVSADVLVEEPGVGAGLALRTRNAYFWRGVTPGLYLYVRRLCPQKYPISFFLTTFPFI